MRILITGASGFIGSHIVTTLLAAQHEVIACVRNPEYIHQRFPAIKTVNIDFMTVRDPQDWLRYLHNIDVVINAVGIINESHQQSFKALHTDGPVTLFRACELAGVKKVIQISALGADDTAFSTYHLSKKAADDMLSQCSLDWTILQPSIVIGPGAKSSSLFKAIAALPIIPLIGGGKQLIQPVSIDDLTALIHKIIESRALNHQRVPVVGAEPVAFKLLIDRFCAWLGFRSLFYINIPYPIMLFIARITSIFTSNSPINSDSIRMLKQENTGDSTMFIDAMQRQPLSLDDTLALQIPDQADRWHARLYFLIPLLRIAIGLLWIITGLLSAFIFPVSESYIFLARLHIDGDMAPMLLYSAAILDILLGMAFLFRYRIVQAGLLQIAIIITYSIFITIGLPEFWLHPFGPVTKNIPIIIATLIVMATDH